MKNSKVLITGIDLIFFIGICFTGCHQNPIDITKNIEDSNKAFMEAFNNGNAHAVAMNYTNDAKLFPANSDVVEGQEAIENFWKGAMGMGVAKADLETVSAEATGNMAVEEGRYKLFTKDDQMIDQGKYIVNWKKVNGIWKLNKDIWNTNNPAPIARAVENDSVWVILNPVKANKVKQFEDFNLRYLEPSAAETYPNMRNTVRMLRPTKPDSKGIYNYVYIMDPASSPDGYDMWLPLKAKYGEEKAGEYLKMFQECLVNGKQEIIPTIQTSW